VTELAFISPDRARNGAGFEPRFASPLARVLAGNDAVHDVSQVGKIEVRGDVDAIDVDAEVLRITPQRALVLCDYDRCAELRERLPGTVIDMTGALAGIELASERAMHRLTDLDLEALPAAGKVADVPAIVTRNNGGARFRMFFPQEYAHYVGEVVLDALEGLWR
jgi:hypothetical protein